MPEEPPASVRGTLRSGAVFHTWTPHEPRAIVVLQHGFNEYAHRFVHSHGHLVPMLLDEGFTVLAPDLWGHGASPGKRGVTHVGRAVSDHLAVRERAASLGLPTFLFGHSLGGLVTAASASTNPRGLRGVVMTAPAFPAPIPHALRRVLGALASVAPAANAPTPKRPLSDLAHDPLIGLEAAADPIMGNRGVPMLLAATALDTAKLLRDGARDWKLPLLALHGTADTYTDPRATAEFVAAVASDDVELRLVKDGFHELLHDIDGQESVDLVLGWMTARVS